jgi:hypothetical protein
MTDLPKPPPPLFERLRLPANVVDVTERAIGTITAVVGPNGLSGASEPHPKATRSPREIGLNSVPGGRKAPRRASLA